MHTNGLAFVAMSNKRSRSTYEDPTTSSSQFALFGTPLPDPSDKRDDGAYLPVWKQEVRDERGRKRLHGAFTGGWSAGYFNTVGTKEGWTPSTFVSSRNNRAAGGEKAARQRAEDFMDEEDLADAAEAQKVETSQGFASFGTGSSSDAKGRDPMGLFKVTGDTMGHRLLQKMGWKDGQGIGPKIRRTARLDSEMKKTSENQQEPTYLFTPDDVPMVQFNHKIGQMGLGFKGEGKLETPSRNKASDEDDDEDEDHGPSGLKNQHQPLSTGLTKKKKRKQGGIGIGILNDNGSDDEDPWELGPKIRYNKVIGGDKKKNKMQTASNPNLKSAPVFLSKTSRAGNSLRRCHDGKLPLDGFILSSITESFASLLSKYAPPSVPAGWKSTRDKNETASSVEYQSTADAARASQLDIKSRAALLGEKALLGKSVFDFLSKSTRDQIAAASGRSDLPIAKGEIPEGQPLSFEDRMKILWEKVPKLDSLAASAALQRTSGGPYGHDEEKRQRYRTYLEHMVKPDQPPLVKPPGVTDDDFVRETTEFFNCAKLFKPMTGFVASRFTTGKTQPAAQSGSEGETELITKVEAKPADPVEEAAKMGMFGQMTRSVADFYPSRLLCKRFNIKPPAHSQPTHDFKDGKQSEPPQSATVPGGSGTRRTEALLIENAAASTVKAPELPPGESSSAHEDTKGVPEKNEAVEAAPAHEDVLKAIFGDSDSE